MSTIVTKYLARTYDLDNASRFLWTHDPVRARKIARTSYPEGSRMAVLQEGLRFTAIDRFYTQDGWLNIPQVVRVRTALRGVPSHEITPNLVLEILGYKSPKARTRFLTRAATQPMWAV